jgi:hypothetical protein
MKKNTTIRILVLLSILIALVGTVFLPNYGALADVSKSPIIRLTILNQSQHPFTLRLYSGNNYEVAYEVTVEQYSQAIMFIERGEYSFWMRACNHIKEGTFDLSMMYTLYVPVCGGNAGARGDKPHNIDVADYIKMVKVTIRNKTKEQIGVYVRTDENHYFLNLKPNETIYQIMPKDIYRVSYVACGDLIVTEYKSLVNAPLDLKCNGD